MSEDGKLALAKQACRYLLDQLNDQDKVSVVRYNTEAQRLVEFTRASERDSIAYTIDNLQPAGRTSVQAGLQCAYDVAAEGFDPKRTNRVILLTDGLANTDRISADEILARTQSARQKGIALTVLGIGFGNYNDALLEQARRPRERHVPFPPRPDGSVRRLRARPGEEQRISRLGRKSTGRL